MLKQDWCKTHAVVEGNIRSKYLLMLQSGWNMGVRGSILHRQQRELLPHRALSVRSHQKLRNLHEVT